MKTFLSALSAVCAAALFAAAPAVPYQHGVLCLTFDDSKIGGWMAALPIFEKYHAHATFFFFRQINVKSVAAMKRLTAAGHSIGLHGFKHRNAPQYIEENGEEAYLKDEILPQLDACRKAGIEIRNFAYPNNKHTAATDKLLSRYFRRFRAGAGRGKSGKKLYEFDPMFHPVSEIPSLRVFGGFGLGKFYKSDEAEIVKVLERIAERNEIVTVFSHDIAPRDSKVHTSGKYDIHAQTEMLITILATAERLGIKVVGFDELPYQE